MENAIVAIVSTILIIISSVIMMMSTLQSSSKIAASWQAMTAEFNDIRTTSISAETDNYYGGPIELKVSNNGQSNLYDFPKWDVIAQYDDGTAAYLAYTEGITAGANQWAVAGIDMAVGEPEVFDPGILNPGEYLRMEIDLDPALVLNHSVRITISTPAGVTAECMVTRETQP